MAKPGLSWLFLMAWRDSRRNLNRLLLFTSSIVLGISALVAINSFGVNLKSDIDEEAKTLIGADFVISSRQPPTENIQAIIDSVDKLATEKSTEISFASMIYFPGKEGTRLANIRALEGKYPYYGEIETEPLNAAEEFQKDKKAVVDGTLLLQFGAKKGDKIKVGNVEFGVDGELIKGPGQTGITSTVAPSIYVPQRFIKETGLLQRGSRINYRYYYKLPATVNVEQLVDNVKKRFEEENVGYDTIARRKRNLGRVFSYLTSFLNLVAFIALLLGCVGVASAVHIYIKEKVKTVAVLRCLGVKGSQAFLIYLVQIGIMGFLGSLIGAVLGSLIQVLLPQVLSDFLPVEVNFAISWSSILQGVLIGLGISILFALIPLLSIRNISPLRTLRASFDENQGSDPLRWFVYALIGLFIGVFAYIEIDGFLNALYFTLSLAGAFLLLTGLARGVIWLTRKYFPVSWNYIWRQSIANLYRPNNQTLTLIVSIGLGTALITILYFVQNMLLNQVAFADRNEQPNMVLFDIQNEQKQEVKTFTESFDLPVMQQVPIVTMRLDNYQGRSRVDWLEDSTRTLPRDILNREYRVTYRDTLNTTEEIVEGTWIPEFTAKNKPIPISMSETHFNRMEAKLGEKIIFDVQGKRIETYIASIRKITFNRVETSFTILFPKGVLEKAPQFHVLITRVPDKPTSAKFQQAIVKKYPNISVVDLNLILDTAEEILGQVSFVIRFMALFSILTGLIVLIGSVILSRYQRLKESVLLRTLGANRRQILWITALEYFFLGSLASLTGILLAIAGGWALAVYSFQVGFVIDYIAVLLVYGIITSLTVIIGLLNSRGILYRPPLEVLRSEVG